MARGRLSRTDAEEANARASRAAMPGRRGHCNFNITIDLAGRSTCSVPPPSFAPLNACGFTASGLS